SILQRMRELATQAANDTNADSDRNEIQKEINELTSEINRISNTTEFNTKKMLNAVNEADEPSAFSAIFQVGANQGQSMTIQIHKMNAEALGLQGVAGDTITESGASITALNSEDGAAAVTDAKFAAEGKVTNGTDTTVAGAALSVADHDDATAA